MLFFNHRSHRKVFQDKKIVKILRKYQGSKYQIAEIQQYKEIQALQGEFGKLHGVCYGITTQMANHALSPYFNGNAPRMTITPEVYTCQKNQLIQALDQSTIKKRLLTRRHFCPNREKQAREILNLAKQHPSKDLILCSFGALGNHASYLRFQVNQDKTEEIWYMDPNYGVLRLYTDHEFIEIQSALSTVTQFTSYQLEEMIYDPQNKNLPELSFYHAWITFLTGCVYTRHARMSEKMAVLLNQLFESLLNGLLLFSPLMCITTFFPPMAALFTTVLIAIFLLRTRSCGYNGILGPIQFLKSCCDELENTLHSWFNPSKKETDNPDDFEYHPC